MVGDDEYAVLPAQVLLAQGPAGHVQVRVVARRRQPGHVCSCADDVLDVSIGVDVARWGCGRRRPKPGAGGSGE